MTQTRLKEKLHYNPETGIFRHLKSNNQMHYLAIAGSPTSQGYIGIKIDSKLYKAHRLAWLYVHGEMPSKFIDHINHIKNDNRIVNLRVVTRSLNGKNRPLQSNNKTGVHGVNWHKHMKRWVARVNVDGKRIQLGAFVNFSDAVNARKNAEVLYGYHSNHGN